MPERRREHAFTLIEIIIALAVLGILATALMPVAVREISVAKRKATETSMQALVRGMVGDAAAGEYGYLGDMGQLPKTLEDLVEQGRQPGFVVDKTDGVGCGWDGPYADNAGAPGETIEDGWGRAYRYDGGSAQIRSAGADGKFGSEDDLLYPDAEPRTTGKLTVVVKGVPDDGSPPLNLSSADAEVWVASASGGRRKEQRLGGGGPFYATALPYGVHGVRVEGIGRFKGVVVRDAVELRSGNRALTLALEVPSETDGGSGGKGGGGKP